MRPARELHYLAPARPRTRVPAQFVVTGIWATVNLIGGLFFLPYAFWIAGTCPESQCGDAGVSTALVFAPSVGAVVGLVLWYVGLRRRGVSGGLGLAWGGVALGLLGGIILVYAIAG